MEFKNKSRPNNPHVAPSSEVFRVRTPRGKEVIGVVEQRFGGAKMMIKCMDGKSRNCRVPGRYRRALWIREGDIVLVEPWEFDDTKGDIIYKYSNAAIQWLEKKGFLKQSSEF